MQSSVKFTSSLVSCSPMDYGSPAVNLMLNQFAAFSLLRRRYFVLYQSIIPNCQRCLAILRDQCDIPDYMEDHILAGSCKRACSQRLFNFLLVKFEKDRDYQEFCDLIKMLMDFVFLRKNVDTLREKFATSAYLSQGRISLWCPPQEVINIEECVGDFDAAIAAQAAGFMPHEVLKMVQLDCTSLKACTSPHYEEHQRRRNKAVLPAVSKLTEQEEVNPPFQLPIERIPSEDHTVPVAFEVCKSPSMESILDEFPPLKVLYSVLVQSLPVNYTESVGHLEQYLTANAIFTIVSSPDADQGNQQIINSLLKQLTCIEDLLELCNRLEKIPNAPALSHAIEDLRKETITYIHLENKEASLGAQMISRNDLSGGNFGGPPLDEAIFEVAEALQPNTIGSEVLKKYYHQLYRSFSRDHMDTLGKLMQLGNVSSEKIDWISSAPNSTTGNQRILDYLLLAMDGENSMLELCDLLEKLIEHPVLLKVVESLRNDLLEVIENTKRSNSPEVSLTLPSDLAELMKNPMDSSGVEQLLARVVSSASTVNKGISPPSIHSYTPSATIEEIIEPEEAKPDDELKSDGDDSIPVGEAMSDTNSAVTTADSSKQPEESISDVRVPYQSPSPPISEHTPVPVSSPVPVITLDAVSAASSTVDVTSSLSVSTDPPISDQPTSSAVSQDESEDTVVDSTMEELLLKPLEMAMQGVPGFHVVKRHYGNLCSCFPSNYKKTVQKLQRLIDLDQEDMVLIISPTGDHPSDPVAVNQRVLMHLFLYCQSDEDLLKICSYLEELVDPTKRLSVDEFRRDLIAFLKKDKEEMEKQKEDDKELNRVMSHTGSVDAGEQPIDLTSDTTTTATTTTTTAAAMGSAIPSEPSVVQGATAAAANITQPSGGEQISYGDSELVKELLTNNEEFVVLNSNYVNLLRSFPEDYASCLNAVIEYITDEQTVLILDSPTPLVANQRILNCLIKQIKSKVEIVTFCDYLDKIENAKLSQAVEKLRNDVLQELHPPVTTTPTAKTIPHSSTDDEAAAAPEITVEHPTPPITDDEREVMELFKASQLDPKYTAVLKNYHAKLVECFPDKLSAIVEAISTQLPSVPDDFIQEIKTTSDASTANKLLLNFLILQLNTSQDVVDLCDTLETLVAGDDAVEVVEALRNDVLVVLLSSDPEEEAEVPISIDRLSSMLNTIDDSPDSSLATPDETNEPAGLVLEPLTDDKPPAETDVPYLDLPMRNKLPLHVATSASNKLPATQAAAPPTEEYLVPPPEKDTEEASTNIFKKYAAVMQNCIHPKRVAEKFDEHKLFSQGTNPISAHSELPNHVQMNYMLESIRTNMAINGAKVLYGLIRSFQSVPDYAELAAYFQADYNQAFGTSEIASKKPLGSLKELEKNMKYSYQRYDKGYGYLPPPPLFPSCHIARQGLIKRLFDAVLVPEFDSSTITICASIIGGAGSGKSTLVTALCHQTEIKNFFKDGFLFVHLATHPDPSTTLSQLYYLLTKKEIKTKEDNGHLDVIISELRHITANYFSHLLVIIEDVWDSIDLEWYTTAFSNCRVIATMQDQSIADEISSSHYIEMPPMETSEAVMMLTNGISDISVPIPKQSADCLEKLVVDLQLCPLLLYLVRGQLLHHSTFQNLSFNDALEIVVRKLHNCGLAAIGHSDMTNKQKRAEKACIDCTVQMLDETEKSRLLSVVFYAGTGNPIPQSIVEEMWEIGKRDYKNLYAKLEECSLFLSCEMYMAPMNIKLACVQVHPVVAKYLIDNTDSLRALQVWPMKSLMLPLIRHQLQLCLPKGVGSSQHLDDFLRDTCVQIDHQHLAENVAYLIRGAFYDPHLIIYQLTCLNLRVRNRPDLVPDTQVQLITDECKKILQDAPNKLRDFHREFEKLLFENDHDGLITLFEKLCTDNPVTKTAAKCVALFKNVADFCHNMVLHWINDAKEQLQLLLSQYHENSCLILPQLKIYIKLRQEIVRSLTVDSTKWRKLKEYVETQLSEELKAVESTCKIKTRDISTKHVHQKLTPLSS